VRAPAAHRWTRYAFGSPRRPRSRATTVSRVTIDVDTIYHGFESVLPKRGLSGSVQRVPGGLDRRKATRSRRWSPIQGEYGMKVAAMTLGAHGALALENGRFHYAPAFVVNCVDTTGAGDVFHGAFCYAVLQNMGIGDALEFSNAMAAVNCTALGARGGIRGLTEVRALMARAERRAHPEFLARCAGAAGN